MRRSSTRAPANETFPFTDSNLEWLGYIYLPYSPISSLILFKSSRVTSSHVESEGSQVESSRIESSPKSSEVIDYTYLILKRF